MASSFAISEQIAEKNVVENFFLGQGKDIPYFQSPEFDKTPFVPPPPPDGELALFFPISKPKNNSSLPRSDFAPQPETVPGAGYQCIFI
jgi:hypothetical protein